MDRSDFRTMLNILVRNCPEEYRATMEKVRSEVERILVNNLPALTEEEENLAKGKPYFDEITNVTIYPKLQTIRAYKKRINCSLDEAKKAVEDWMEHGVKY